MKIITLPEGIRINADAIVCYSRNESGGGTSVSLADGSVLNTAKTVEEMDRELSGMGALSEKDRETISLFSHKVTEFGQAVLRMPTSVKMRY